MVLTKEPIRVVLNSYRKVQTYFCIKSAGGHYFILANVPDATLPGSLPGPRVITSSV